MAGSTEVPADEVPTGATPSPTVTGSDQAAPDSPTPDQVEPALTEPALTEPAVAGAHPSAAEVPPGWYPDPTGRHQHRYWQSTGWTDTVADDGRTAHDPPMLTLSGATGSPTAPAPWAPTPPPMPGFSTPAPMPGHPAPAAVPSHWAPPSGPAVAGPPPPAFAAAPAGRRGRKWWLIPVVIVTVLALVAGVTGWVVWSRPGPAPVQLVADSVSSGSVKVSWSAPVTGKAPQRYVIRRDGVEVGRTTGERSYLDTGLAPLSAHRYRVLAVVSGRASRPSAELVVNTLPVSPFGLTSAQVTTTSAVITWTAPPGPRPEKYILRRDGGDLVTLPPDTLSYKDSTLSPETKVSYTVIAVTHGQRSDPSPTLQVLTLTPPVTEARLQDTWDVTMTVSKNSGTRLRVGDSGGGTWTFVPTCAQGACNVRVSGTIAERPFALTLTRSGGVYKGSGPARIARCGSTDVTDTVTLTVKVTTGGMAERTWVASEWAGALTLAMPYTRVGNYYCPSQNVSFSVSPDGVTADRTT